MDPLRNNCWLSYGRPLYIWKLLFFETIYILHFSSTLSFPTDRIQLFAQDRVPEETKTIYAGPLNRSIGLEKDH
jgi:hypothetical protein